MTDEQILASKKITLKPNPYLKELDIPYNYQKKMILLMLKRPRMLNGDDVGLGKTLDSIVHFTYVKTQQPNMRAIVLTEKIAMDQWVREFEWLTTGLRTKVITADTHEDKMLRVSAYRNLNVDVLITTYSQVYRYLEYIKEGLGPEYVLYADEPNYFKNHLSVLHGQISELSAQAKRAYGMTATVVENRLEECLAVLDALAPGVFMSMTMFHRNFCIRQKLRNRKIWITVGYKNIPQFKDYVRNFFYGRTQDDPEVEQDLPEVVTKNIYLTMSRQQSDLVLQATDKLLETPTGQIQRLHILTGMIRAQQLCNDPGVLKYKHESSKMEALTETMKGALKGQRVVIFSKFRSQIDRLQKRFHTEGVDCLRITGTENQHQRKIAKDRFMSDGLDRCNVLLINKAGSRAANLQKGEHIFFFDVPWSYGLYRQIVGRLKRTGSIHKKVKVYHLIARLHSDVSALAGSDETIDDYALKVIWKKKQLFDAMTDTVEEVVIGGSEHKEIYEELVKRREKKP